MNEFCNKLTNQYAFLYIFIFVYIFFYIYGYKFVVFEHHVPPLRQLRFITITCLN